MPAAGSAVREVLVLGMGATGASCARHFAARGTTAWFADTRAAPPGLAAIRAGDARRRTAGGQRSRRGARRRRRASSCRRASTSTCRVLADARRRGAAGAERPRPVRRRVPRADDRHHRLQRQEHGDVDGRRHAGRRRLARRRSAATSARRRSTCSIPPSRAYVLELSSFQLERSAPLPLAAAVVLNVAPDHLDKHGDMAAYTAAKARIYARCGIAVVNRDEPALARAGARRARPRSASASTPRAQGHFGLVGAARRRMARLRRASALLPVGELGTTGRHNVSNALAALALVHAVGAGPWLTCCRHCAHSAALPHRMQVVATAGRRHLDRRLQGHQRRRRGHQHPRRARSAGADRRR